MCQNVEMVLNNCRDRPPHAKIPIQKQKKNYCFSKLSSPKGQPCMYNKYHCVTNHSFVLHRLYCNHHPFYIKRAMKYMTKKKRHFIIQMYLD